MENATEPLFEDSAATPPANDAAGKTAIDREAKLAAKLATAGDRALAEQLAETPAKRRPGRPRKLPLPVGEMAGAALPPRVGETAGQALPIDFAPPDSAIDEALLSSLADGLIEGLNDFAAGLQRQAAMHWTGDKTVAEQAALGARMSEKVQAAIRAGAIACARKYAVNLEYAPEVAFGGGLLLWAASNYRQYVVVREQGKKLREPKVTNEVAN